MSCLAQVMAAPKNSSCVEPNGNKTNSGICFRVSAIGLGTNNHHAVAINSSDENNKARENLAAMAE